MTHSYDAFTQPRKQLQGPLAEVAEPVSGQRGDRAVTAGANEAVVVAENLQPAAEAGVGGCRFARAAGADEEQRPTFPTDRRRMQQSGPVAGSPPSKGDA